VTESDDVRPLLIASFDSSAATHGSSRKWLEALIKHASIQACARYGDCPQQIVEDEALGLLWEKSPQFLHKYADQTITEQHLFNWLRKMLKNFAIDKIRRENKLRREENEPELLPARPCEPTLFEPLSKADLKVLETWKPEPRVLALSILGIWGTVGPERWNRWLVDAEFEPPFPPDAVSVHDEPHERIASLADILHMKRNTLQKRWRQYQEKLKCLPSFEVK